MILDKIFTQSCGYMDNDRDIAQLSISEILKIKKKGFCLETIHIFTYNSIKSLADSRMLKKFQYF